MFVEKKHKKNDFAVSTVSCLSFIFIQMFYSASRYYIGTDGRWSDFIVSL